VNVNFMLQHSDCALAHRLRDRAENTSGASKRFDHGRPARLLVSDQMLTLARAARTSGGMLVGTEIVEQALRLLGARADMPLEDESRETRALIASQFVRRLKGVSVEKLHDFERMLLVELRAAPAGVQDVLIRDAISVIKARNHLGQIAKALGLGWADGMRLESAVSDLVRYAAGNGGGLMQTTVDGKCARIELKLRLHDSPPDLTLLGALDPLSATVRSKRHGSQLVIELTLGAVAGAGAA
jgi:hypothetical protein